ncbi:hypothetical protein CNMCM8927_005291 [Aspergillus lentulus]|uniref:GET complex, subunit GET2 n=1 Tax=Aspergillus lentulus TaxID=293939 RepID=A0AAN5YQL3_ASPLE|nr:hypothetical protein CNMCM8060_001922 [Aspergillus lentulus]KAF4197091.1 hypothetical protein CNMCM8694_003858 [Aspergillus lentulus]KAF4206184.1 hypothetical protein CNMCM8927_005291 [Aspergillus lentulus]
MSSTEESPAQRAARLRRERREAKIREGGAARLDKITSLSGRTPQSAREESFSAPSLSPSPSPQPPAPVSVPETGAPRQTQPAPVRPTASVEDQPAEDLQAQQEYIRALLRQNAPPAAQEGPDEDPTMKLLNSLMAGGMPGLDQGAGEGGAAGPGVSQAELASALGLPPFVSSMLGAATRPKTDEEKREIWVWKALHVLFSVVLGVYFLVVISASVATYGSQPPPPATARNPFVLFTTGEMVLSGARIMLRSRGGGLAGPGMWIQLFRDIIQDGSIVLFLLGMSAWWHRDWLAS